VHDVKDVHPAKVLALIAVTYGGTVKSVKEVHPLNTPIPIVPIVDGNVIVFNVVQFLNEFAPIVVNELLNTITPRPFEYVLLTIERPPQLAPDAGVTTVPVVDVYNITLVAATAVASTLKCSYSFGNHECE